MNRSSAAGSPAAEAGDGAHRSVTASHTAACAVFVEPSSISRSSARVALWMATRV